MRVRAGHSVASRPVLAAASAVLGAGIGVALLFVVDQPPPAPEVLASTAAVATEQPTAAPVAATPASEPAGELAPPVRVVIPAIDVDADLVGVGLNPDTSMETPDFGLAGWYTPGPVPGEPGPAVIAAHVDSVAGPDVFYRLSDLRKGDRVVVEHADGTRSAFVVRRREQQRKDELPVERIWNDTDQRVLRLITCGGEFDAERRSYESNVIVFAASST